MTGHPPTGNGGEAPPPEPNVLLDVREVSKHFPIGSQLIRRNVVRAVEQVSFTVAAGETLGLVGESGCGKSTLARLVTRLHPATAGQILFGGVDLVKVQGQRLRMVRRQLQMVFQDPYASLNPRMTVGRIIGEPLSNFGVAEGAERDRLVREVMEVCGLNPRAADRYPHEFSGGQRQRVGIARALVLRPSFIVADEPISALDVSIQAQIINLLQDLQQMFQLTYLFIGHDLAVVRKISDRIAVMYLGKIVEVADSAALYDNPLHPYTSALISAIPVPDPDRAAAPRPIELKGEIDSPVNPPSGCRFHRRCPIARFPLCQEEEPPLVPGPATHLVACHFPGELG